MEATMTVKFTSEQLREMLAESEAQDNLAAEAKAQRKWDDEDIFQWGVEHPGFTHKQLNESFDEPPSENSSTYNVLRRLSVAGRCVRVKRGVWHYYFGESMPPEPRAKSNGVEKNGA
jgi:hypothetical protein